MAQDTEAEAEDADEEALTEGVVHMTITDTTEAVIVGTVVTDLEEQSTRATIATKIPRKPQCTTMFLVQELMTATVAAATVVWGACTEEADTETEATEAAETRLIATNVRIVIENGEVEKENARMAVTTVVIIRHIAEVTEGLERWFRSKTS